MLTTLLEIAGMGLIVAGVAFINLPAALVVAGSLFLVAAFVRGADT